MEAATIPPRELLPPHPLLPQPFDEAAHVRRISVIEGGIIGEGRVTGAVEEEVSQVVIPLRFGAQTHRDACTARCPDRAGVPSGKNRATPFSRPAWLGPCGQPCERGHRLRLSRPTDDRSHRRGRHGAATSTSGSQSGHGPPTLGQCGARNTRGTGVFCISPRRGIFQQYVYRIAGQVIP